MNLPLPQDTAPKQTAAPAETAPGASAGRGCPEASAGRLDARAQAVVAEGDGFSVAAVARCCELLQGDLVKSGLRGPAEVAHSHGCAGRRPKGADAETAAGRLPVTASRRRLPGLCDKLADVITDVICRSRSTAPRLPCRLRQKPAWLEIVLTNGPIRWKQALEPWFLAGRQPGLLSFDRCGGGGVSPLFVGLAGDRTVALARRGRPPGFGDMKTSPPGRPTNTSSAFYGRDRESRTWRRANAPDAA